MPVFIKFYPFSSKISSKKLDKLDMIVAFQYLRGQGKRIPTSWGLAWTENLDYIVTKQRERELGM